MALTLIGEGEVFFMGERKDTRNVLESLGIESITLQAKEGLALINGTQPMTAQGVVNYIEADKLMHDSFVDRITDASGTEWYYRCLQPSNS